MLYVAAGIGLVAAAHALSLRTSEPEEMAITEPGLPMQKRTIHPPSDDAPEV
jgi:hypothetical protein